eukprot:679118-Prorocentrum_minimum.AAC.2
MTRLEWLSFLNAAGLTGTIPSELGALTGLGFLTFSGADGLSGTIPSEITRLSTLSWCYDQQDVNRCY